MHADKHKLGRPSTICFIFLLLAPALAIAGEGVDVSFSVQAVRLQDTISSRLSAHAQWALVAVDAGTGESLVHAGSAGNTPFIPGSLMKLFVTAAILERNAHEAINIDTVVALSGNVTKNRLKGDVFLKGAGNPLLSTKDLQEAVEKIGSLGIKEIDGDVVIDDSLFDTKGWQNRYSGPAYGAPSALGLDMHTIALTIDGSGRMVIAPPNDSVKVSINPSGKPDIRQIDDLTYETIGAAEDVPSVHKRFPLNDPALYAGGTFSTLLKKQGIKISGTVKRGVSPAEARDIARIGSLDIASLVGETNRQSLNVAADNLLFLLGAQTFGAPGTKEKGIRAVKDFVLELGVPITGLVVADGSGVSELSRITPEQMVTFLLSVSRKPWFPSFLESLSRPGMDGRLKDFGYHSDRMRLKFGQVRDAYCIAGYVDRKDGNRIAFAFMVNGPDANAWTSQTAAVEALKSLAD